MPRYGTFRYGTSFYGSIPLADRTASNLQSRRGVEGPQIILSWDKPTDYTNVTRMKLQRKMGSYPTDANDGVTLLDTVDASIETFTDFPEFAPEFFYYKIFTEYNSAWFSTVFAEVVELAHDTKIEFQDKFFRELPEIYRVFDKGRFGSRQLQLAPTQLDAQEKILLAEDGQTDQGELRRFLKIFNIFFNEPLALIRAIATRDGLGIIHDVKRTAPQYLALISELYGWAFNWDLPVDAARKEVVDLPDTYRKKGRKDVTEQFINNILTGHTVSIITPDEVIDLNGYPNGFLDTTDLIGEVDWLTALSRFYVFADINDASTIGFNKIAINVIPGATIKLKSSQIVKTENVIDDFFNILDDVYIFVHETFNLTYPTDITTAGQAFLTPYFPLPNPNLLQAFGHFGVGGGIELWDETGPPTPSASQSRLVQERYRAIPRNIVFLDGSDNPTLTATKKVLLRCFMDLETFTSLYSREAGIFGNDSGPTKDSGTLLAAKNFPIRFIDERVRYIVDFKIQFP